MTSLTASVSQVFTCYIFAATELSPSSSASLLLRVRSFRRRGLLPCGFSRLPVLLSSSHRWALPFIPRATPELLPDFFRPSVPKGLPNGSHLFSSFEVGEPLLSSELAFFRTSRRRRSDGHLLFLLPLRISPSGLLSEPHESRFSASSDRFRISASRCQRFCCLLPVPAFAFTGSHGFCRVPLLRSSYPDRF